MILYQQHVMWYESEMINETLDSLQIALQYSEVPVQLKFCLNSQTYLETPIKGKSEDMFTQFINHPVLVNAEIIYKTNLDPFYNIGDWRREMYDVNAKYTVWGESDTMIPEDYFYIISQLNINEPHTLSLSSRKMWDASWTVVEHSRIQMLEPNHDTLGILSCGNYINYDELNKFNNQDGDINIIKLPVNKIDGSLLALSSNLPNPFISPEQHFVGEDTAAAIFFKFHKIPQYHISNRIKGHNYSHPRKRTNTDSTRNDAIFIQYADQSRQAMSNFIANL
jgi:hypothetical protein